MTFYQREPQDRGEIPSGTAEPKVVFIHQQVNVLPAEVDCCQSGMEISTRCLGRQPRYLLGIGVQSA